MSWTASPSSRKPHRPGQSRAAARPIRPMPDLDRPDSIDWQSTQAVHRQKIASAEADSLIAGQEPHQKLRGGLPGKKAG